MSYWRIPKSLTRSLSGKSSGGSNEALLPEVGREKNEASRGILQELHGKIDPVQEVSRKKLWKSSS